MRPVKRTPREKVLAPKVQLPAAMIRRRVVVAIAALLLCTCALVACWRLTALRAFWEYRAPPTSLTVPVAGLPLSQVHSTFGAPRSHGRRHQGADLFSPAGTPVISACRGRVARVGVDALGGNVVWVMGEGRSLYYYAHLREPSTLVVGQRLGPGDIIGSVGNTGNALTTPPHLHFGIYRVGLWRPRAVDPARELVALAHAPQPSSPPSSPK